MKPKPPKKQSIPAPKNIKKVKTQGLSGSSASSGSHSSPSSSSSILSFLSRLLPPYLKNKTEEKKRPGFTLIELMVVMAIISILATAGLSAYTSYLKGARDSKRASIAREMRTIVESLTTITGAPTPEELDAYLTAEGLAWDEVVPENLLVSVVGDVMSSVGNTISTVTDLVGVPSAWAAFKDPVGGKATCLNHAFDAVIVCQFVYYKFSDGTYAISYGVEKKENLVNPHYSGLVTPRTYGTFVGNSAAITIPHSTTDIEMDTNALSAVGISDSIEANSISVVPAGTCSGSACNLDACTRTTTAATVGTTCADGTKYVNASLRTTPSDAGSLRWGPEAVTTGATSTADGEWNTNRIVTSYTLASYPAFKTCSDLVAHGQDDWYLPAKDQLNLLYTNRGLIGGFSSASFPDSLYWSSSENTNYYAWTQFFQTGAQSGGVGNDKNGAKRVRCVRTP